MSQAQMSNLHRTDYESTINRNPRNLIRDDLHIQFKNLADIHVNANV